MHFFTSLDFFSNSFVQREISLFFGVNDDDDNTLLGDTGLLCDVVELEINKRDECTIARIVSVMQQQQNRQVVRQVTRRLRQQNYKMT